MSRVIGGFPVGADGRVHTTFSHNPSTLRLSSLDPNLQNIPRGTDSEVQKWVKEIFVAGPGTLFWELDYNAIEAILVGYLAGSARYTRLARLGVHAYVLSHLVGRVADLSWSDSDLREHFGVLKADEPVTYDTAKRIVYLSNYKGTPAKIVLEYPHLFPKGVKEAARLQDFYFELFPEIPAWHRELCLSVDGTKQREVKPGEVTDPWTYGVCYVRTPFDYVYHFYNTVNWEKVDLGGGESKWIWSYGDDAKRLIASVPQGTAAAILKKAVMGVWYTHPEVRETLRLLIHDSIFGEGKEDKIEECIRVVKGIMELPHEELPLDPTWGMGEFLSFKTEAKVGKSWGHMERLTC